MLQTQEAPVSPGDWRLKVAKKQERINDKLVDDWRLPESIKQKLQYPLEKNPNRLIELDIHRQSGILTDQELKITEGYTVGQLLEALRTGKLSSFEVTIAFSKRAHIAGELTNCVTETYFPEAQARAKELDSLQAQGHLAGPLHGLPISLKDCFNIKGLEATIGFVSFIDRVAEENSPLVNILIQLGAVPFVKTNVPHTMMTADSHNNIFGRTLNPHNTMLTAGGSSGGEGALVAFRASPLGIGTDIAGSIRIPSFCDGTYGFKPTTSRIPYGGQASPAPPGYDFFLASAGPLANDAEALQILTKAVLDAKPATYDATALDVPWTPSRLLGKVNLRFGVLAEDPVYPWHPPVLRAMVEAVARLKAHGHEIVQLQPDEGHVADACELGFAFFSGGPRYGPLEESGEDPVPSVLNVRGAIGTMPCNILADIEGLEGVQRLAALNSKRKALWEEWRQNWLRHKIDAVLAPPAQHTAVPHDNFTIPAYTTFLNTLDYPACIIPFGKSSKTADPKSFSVGSGCLGASYDPELMDGAPCSVQIFTSRMRDEDCLEIAIVVDKCLNT